MTWTGRHGTGFLLVLTLILAGCKKQSSPPVVAETGVASWYGHPFDGRHTASGEIYDMEKLTAAHRTYAFGTVVHVTNQTNGKVVEVRINDRGPFVAGRIIDLSHAAAQSIAMSSIANVRLVVTSTPRTRELQNYAVQTGNFVDRQGAAALLEQMKGQYGEAKLIYRPGDESWRVLVGRLPSVESADSLAQQIERQTGSAFVVLLENEQ
jgi:rare lipoprotein A